MTILICAGQAPGYIATQITSNAGVVPDASGLWWFTAVLVLITGTIFVMWLGERITDRGIGNGISLLIMIGIIAGLPQSLITEFTLALGTKVGGLVMFMVEMATLLIVIMVFMRVMITI